jgi:hypothetical protein
LIAGAAVALGAGFATGAAAQTCDVPVTGNVDLTGTIDAAAGRLTLDAPDSFGDTLTIPASIVLDATVESTGAFSVPGEFVLAVDGVDLTWRVTSGTLTVNEADQAGTFELAAELVTSSDDTERSGTFQLVSDISVVDLVQPTPLLITGSVTGNIACGPVTDQGGTVTTTAPQGGGDGATGGTGQDVAAQDEDLAMTGVSPVLMLIGAFVALAGLGAVVYGLGRVRIARWFPKTMPGEFTAGP